MRPADLVARYEQLRHIAAGGHAGGWRHGLGVLVAPEITTVSKPKRRPPKAATMVLLSRYRFMG